MKSGPKVYARAPVVEAVIDIQVQLGNHADDCVTRLRERLTDRFPKQEQLHMFSMEMRPDGSSVQRDAIGWRLTNGTADRVLQVKRQGFTYSHMSPYTQWTVFSQEGRRLWADFVDCCSPTAVTRVAVRYVNRLKLPAGEIQLEDFLALYPEVPTASAYDPIQGLLMQVQGRHANVDPMCQSVVTLATEPSFETGFQPLLLDIDVFVEKPLPGSGDECWKILEALRLKKNELFESAIKDKLRETFQ